MSADRFDPTHRDSGEDRSETFSAAHELVRAAQAGDERAKETLVETNLALVAALARRYGNQGLPPADLVQEGTLGLLDAVATFNMGGEHSFATHASTAIVAAIEAALGRTAEPPSLATVVSGIRRCGDPDCRCARYVIRERLTAEALLEDVRRDHAMLIERLRCHPRGGAVALNDKSRVICQRLREAIGPEGQIGLIGDNCVWRAVRSRLISGLKDVNAGRYERGFRHDVRPERRPDRGVPDRRGFRPRVREQVTDPELLARLCDASTSGDPLERVLDDVPPTELQDLVDSLTPRLREAIELELVRADDEDLFPLTSTERVRHFRAARKLAELILERPELAHLHGLARLLLEKDRQDD